MTIALKTESAGVKTALTDAEGHFVFEKVPFGKYVITAVAVGYQAKNLNVILVAERPVMDLGHLEVTPQSNNLKEVAITSDRPLIRQEVDRISYDIQADPENKILTALDMMRKVPLLSLDADDNIKLKGSAKYKIFINGKPSSMIAQSPKDVLRSMPASSIQKIEVITTPPAKYDSEGLTGIINIITSRKIDNGYNGGLNLRQQGPVGGPGIGGFISIKQNKLGLTANGGTGFYTSPETSRENSRTTTGDNPTSLTSSGTRKFNNNYRYISVEASYELDTLNLITAQINPYSGYNKPTILEHYDLTDGVQHTAYDVLTRSRYNWEGLDASVNYQLGFRRSKEQLLTFSYKYSYYSSPQKNSLGFTNRVNYADPDYIQDNDSRAREQTLQIDYVQPLKKVTIEAGVKGILRDNSSDFEYRNFDQQLNGYLTDPGRTNKFDNNQDILGAYNSYALNLKSWSFKGGARMEGTFVKANFVSTNSNVNSNYFNLIPTISVNRKFKDMSSLNFGYTQRIERPGIDNLNPFVDRYKPNFEMSGNPDLKAVLSNNFELSYSKFKKGSINAGLSYSFANNTIQSVSVFNEADNITRTTYQNIGKNKNLTSNLNISYPISEKWNLSVSGNIGYLWIEGAIDGSLARNSGVAGYGYVNTGYKFEKQWKVNASFNYSAPDIMLQGKSGSYTYTSFSGSKEIIKDKLTLSGAINNPFAKFRYYTENIQGTNFVQHYRSQNYNRAYNVSLNWRFGKLKDAVKKNARSINNDDVKSGGNKS